MLKIVSTLSLTVASIVVLLPAIAHAQDTTVRILRAEPGNEGEKALLRSMAEEYARMTPGVKVSLEFMDNESFKQKLPTMLQSGARPDIFYSWGGGVLADQFKAGFAKDISQQVQGEWAGKYSTAGVSAFTVEGKIVGVPISASDVGFWVNKPLADKAGIDLSAIKTWDDFLTAVQKAKDAGLTPIALGAKDKWPAQLYLGYLAVRVAGQEGFAAAMRGEAGGFRSEAFIKAAAEFKRLIDMKPFQAGFADSAYAAASGMFGDGGAVFHLMGDWEYQAQRGLSQSKAGLSDTQLALIPFPSVTGGAGDASDTFGGINGWVVAKGASREAIDFLKWFNAPEQQTKMAAGGFNIPVAKGADSALTNPFFRQIADRLGKAAFHQIFLDQALGADVGASFNDAATDLALGVVTPEEAMESIQQAWEMR